MYITKKFLSRRTLLQGAGVSIALPFLDSMVPAFASTPDIPLRFGVTYSPNGIIREAWEVPEGQTATRDMIYSTWVKKPRVFSGIDNGESESISGHVGGSSMYLTGMEPKKSLSEIYCGVSIVQIIAEQTSKETSISSLQICVENAAELSGQSAGGYSSAYTNTISWASPTTPLPMEHRPNQIFDQLFGISRSVEERRDNLLRNKSILDWTLEQTKRTMKRVGITDNYKLDEYLTAIRQVEQQLEIAAKKNIEGFAIPEKTIGIPAHDEHIKVMLELMRIAFQIDMTRVFTFMVAREYSELVFSHLGHQDPYHPTTHHRGSLEKKDKAIAIDIYHGEVFGKFVRDMEDTKEIDGSSLLDHTVLLYGAGMGDGDVHNQWDVPVFLLGGGIKPGFQYEPSGTPMCNVRLGILKKFGIEREQIGQSTGIIEV